VTEFSQPYHVYWDAAGFHVRDAEEREIDGDRFQSYADAEKHLDELEAGEAHEAAVRIADKTVEVLKLFGGVK
jgi:hypothetical protein